jgi:hypothetical protein
MVGVSSTAKRVLSNIGMSERERSFLNERS